MTPLRSAPSTFRPEARVEIAGEALHVHAELLRVADEIRVGEQEVVHGQNAPAGHRSPPGTIQPSSR